MYLKSNRAGVVVERIGSKRQHKYKLTEKSIIWTWRWYYIKWRFYAKCYNDVLTMKLNNIIYTIS